MYRPAAPTPLISLPSNFRSAAVQFEHLLALEIEINRTRNSDEFALDQDPNRAAYIFLHDPRILETDLVLQTKIADWLVRASEAFKYVLLEWFL